MEEFQVMPRIVLISDGRPTDIRLIGRENDSPEYETNSVREIKIRLLLTFHIVENN